MSSMRATPEEAISQLAEQPFDAQNFPYAFLEAFGCDGRREMTLPYQQDIPSLSLTAKSLPSAIAVFRRPAQFGGGNIAHETERHRLSVRDLQTLTSCMNKLVDKPPLPGQLGPRGIVLGETDPVEPLTQEFERMARRRFQDPKPRKEGNFWYLSIWQDTVESGRRTPTKKDQTCTERNEFPGSSEDRGRKAQGAKPGADHSWVGDNFRGFHRIGLSTGRHAHIR